MSTRKIKYHALAGIFCPLYKNEGSCIDVPTGQLKGREAASQKPQKPRKCSHRTADGQKYATK